MGPQGFGKTMWVLQALRNMVAEGHHGVYFSYEHDEYTVLERLIALEAGLLYGPEAVGMRRIRAALEATDGRGDIDLADRLADTAGGREALQMVRSYSPRLFFARSNGATSDIREIAERTEEIIRQTGELPVVVVDYLQKVPVPTGRTPRRSGSRWSPRASRTSRCGCRSRSSRSSPPSARAWSPASGCGSTCCAARRRSPTSPTSSC